MAFHATQAVRVLLLAAAVGAWGADAAPDGYRASQLAQFNHNFDHPRWSSAGAGGDTVAPNASQTWGEWEGWGTSLCWWANVFGQRDDLADLVFTLKNVSLGGQELPGLGMNIARYNAGGSSYTSINGTKMVSSPNIPSWKQIQGFWVDWSSRDASSESWNWTADANQINMARLARERGATHIELFSNSPMWWSCTNHNPSGNDNGALDNLQSWNYDQHAAYLATVAQQFPSRFGVAFDSVEAFNEPISNWWKASGTQEGCHFDHSTQETVANLLRTELDARGLSNLVVAASDENQYDEALATWLSFNKTTKLAVGQVNTHGYQQGGGRRDLLFAATQGKRLWNSEYGEGDATGLSLATNLNLDFTWLHNTAWVYWQAFDGSDWGLVEASPGAKTIGKVNQKYYVLAQYTRHIRPGMTIVETGDANTVAAYNASSRVLVLVTTNYNTPQTINYDLAAFRRVPDGIAAGWRTSMQGHFSYQAMPGTRVIGGQLSITFEVKSIATLEVRGVVL